MPRLNVMPDHPLLVRMLREPNQLPSLTPNQFSRLIDVADHARLLGWLVSAIDRGLMPEAPPDWLQDRLVTVRAFVREYERAMRWEIDRLNRAFSTVGIPWVLLKGAAYVAAALPPGRGRKVADIDVLVSIEDLPMAERALNAHGWSVGELHDYDDKYYRNWMHELPPMTHKDRRSVVDVHHAILPLTSRLQPSTPRLLAGAVSLDGDVRVLSPAHMVLHGAVHLFHDGEISGAIRDVVDLDGLLRHFSQQPRFWTELLEQSQALGLRRPAYYALRYAQRLLGTPVPADVLAEMAGWGPPWPVGSLMDALVERTLPGNHVRGSSTAALALYVRSHWLRMPPLMLAQHLLKKSLRRQKT
jgi:hypothetical protein